MAKFCHNCGEKVEPKWRVCPECGTSLVKVEVSQDLEQPIKQAEPIPPPQQVSKQELPVQVKEGNLLEKSSYLVPFLGGIIICVALLTPAAWLHRNIYGFDMEYEYIWIFGLALYYWWETGLVVQFLPNMVGGVPTIVLWVVSILLVLGAIFIIIVSRLIKTRKMKSDNLALGLGIIVILCLTTIWMILMESFFHGLFASNRFWGTVYPGFGIIGIFLGVIIIIIGISLNSKYKKRIQLS